MDNYYFFWRRKLFWKKELVSGHKFEKDQNKMVIYYTDGSIKEIKNWSNCEMKLGVDWVAVVKKDISETVGK